MATGSKMKKHRSRGGRPPLDLRGKRFGKLVASRRRRDGKWLCECDCGKRTVVYRGALTSGHTQSCGCLRREQSGNSRTKRERMLRHGGREQTVRAWADEVGINPRTLIARLDRGWKTARALYQPTEPPSRWLRAGDEKLVRLAQVTAERVLDPTTRSDLKLLIEELGRRLARRKVRRKKTKGKRK